MLDIVLLKTLDQHSNRQIQGVELDKVFEGKASGKDK
jgi:hypothetical protein